MELSVRDLTVSLGARAVLHGVSAAFRPGKITAILGPNGSGKTTLIKALAGLIVPDSGRVTLNDRPIARIEPRERARLIGYLPQDGAVHWNLGVEELVALGRMPHRSPFAGPGPEDATAIAAALTATDATDLAGRRVQELSGGERARVLLARVLAGEPQWLLADEPLASLDPAHQFAMLDQLRALAATGMGVVIVLHDLIQAARIADDVLLLKDGRIVAHGGARETLTPDPIAETFGVSVTMVEIGSNAVLPVLTGRATP